MTVYKLTENEISKVPETSFQSLGLTERYDIQRLLRDNISIIAPDCMVISEEFGNWQDSRRRIDLLAIDKHANLVVIELKRTEDGGHMDLQAIRYAAMVSAFSFSDAVEIYGQYLKKRDSPLDPSESLLTFLSWAEADEENFAPAVRIILASADFSKELTSSVIWLNNDCDLDIRCVRIKPYGTRDNVLIDVQQIIPLPEAQDYQVRLKAKKQVERRQKRQYDYTKYDVTCGDQCFERMNKRRAMLQIVTFLASKGHSPAELNDHLSQQTPKARLPYCCEEGNLNCEAIEELLEAKQVDLIRFLTKDDELIHIDNKTYAISNQWGKNFDPVVGHITTHFAHSGIKVTNSQI